MTAFQKPVMGNQTPRLAYLPKYHSNAYEEAVDLCAAYGLHLDDWQATVLKAWLGEDAAGLWVSPINGLSVPRQNGKGAVLEARELFGAVILGERILHTAHLLKTSKDHFARMLKHVDPQVNPELAKLVKRISRVNGEEAIEFTNGGVIKFVARSKNSGRGFTADLLVCDEAQDMSDDDYAALQPTLYSVKNPQTILTGTPPIPSVDGTVFARYRDVALKGEADRFSWLEWSAETGDDYSDPTTWAKANPSLGIRGEVSTVHNEFLGMDDETFARERLGMWAGIGANSMFDMEHWDTLKSNVDPTDPVAFAIDVSPDLTIASIGMAGYVGDKVSYQVVANRKGTGWIVEALRKLQADWNPVAIVIDSYGPGASLLPDLRAARIRVVEVSSSQVVQSCMSFYNSVVNVRMMHADQPVLNAAIAGASKRPVGQGWAWNRKNPNTDITPLVAVTLAGHGLTSKRKPPSERRASDRRVLMLK
ncbi:terminase large subunit domain-containing protein [Nocardioides abyssi]|uniref:Terminase large subunit n=1 Tax=Nocardioides abyssi TaxID=3058370 RepID=A0ABT8EXZ5_9ACTN|nr:terminase large subunit [Nocardioides abyssi]MDN4162949.1 terminase large subunit [Nocardioides abyssi]